MLSTRMRVFAAVTIIAVFPAAVFAQDNSERWAGGRTANNSSQAMILNLNFSQLQKSTVDLPDFGALEIPASRILITAAKIHFELIGDTGTAVFEGTIGPDTIEGSWKEGTHSGEFELHHQSQSGKMYDEEEVLFKNGDVRLSGSLLTPKAHAPYPAVVFIHGSGPESRDPSRFLAQVFVSRGIAALIYDKRGVGASTGDWRTSSFDDLAKDALAAVEYLEKQPNIIPSRIGLMGSSQGGWIAPITASLSPDIGFVILKSAASVTPEVQELSRTEMWMSKEGDSPAAIKQAVSLYQQVIRYARSRQGWDQLSASMKAASGQKWFQWADLHKNSSSLDFIRLNFSYDPMPFLEKLHCPVLAIFGADDSTVPVGISVSRMSAAFSTHSGESLIAIFPGAGHDLRVEAADRQPWFFPRLAPGYLDMLTSWVLARTEGIQSAPTLEQSR